MHKISEVGVNSGEEGKMKEIERVLDDFLAELGYCFLVAQEYEALGYRSVEEALEGEVGNLAAVLETYKNELVRLMGGLGKEAAGKLLIKIEQAEEALVQGSSLSLFYLLYELHFLLLDLLDQYS